MKLGIVYKDGFVINHRSLVKVLFNPLLRYFGYHIASKFKDGIVGKPLLVKTDKQPIKWERYNSDYDYILKKRIFI